MCMTFDDIVANLKTTLRNVATKSDVNQNDVLKGAILDGGKNTFSTLKSTLNAAY